MTTIAPDDVREGMQVRIIITHKPNGPLVEGRQIFEGEVTGLSGNAAGAIWAHLDGDKHFAISLTDDELATVEIIPGQWRDGTLAKVDLIYTEALAVAEGDEVPQNEFGALAIREEATLGWRVVSRKWPMTIYDGAQPEVQNIRKIAVPA